MSNQIPNPMLPEDFESRSPIEKKRFLDSAADKIRNDQTARRPLSDDEMEQLRYDLQKLSINLSDMQDEYDEIKKHWREKINDAKEAVSLCLDKLKQGFERVTGTTYELRDYENERVYVVMEDGTTIDNRKMLPDERQQTIQSGMREVSNDG